MLIQLTKQQTVTETVELQLPAYYSLHACQYAILEDETIVRAFISQDGYASLSTYRKETSLYKSALEDIMKGEVSNEQEFGKVLRRALADMELLQEAAA